MTVNHHYLAKVSLCRSAELLGFFRSVRDCGGAKILPTDLALS